MLKGISSSRFFRFHVKLQGHFLVDELYIFLAFARLLSVEGPKAKGAEASVEGFVRQPGLSKAKAEHILRFDDLDWDGQKPGFQQDVFLLFFVSPLKSLSYYFFFVLSLGSGNISKESFMNVLLAYQTQLDP